MNQSSLASESSAGNATWTRDLMASFVVCLVALPLCMGIAIASGAPPAVGLVTGILGGVIVGMLSGAPLQVSGPAAGLTVLIYEIVQSYGIAGMGLAVLVGGAVQLVAGTIGLGRWFRAVSPAVIQGMLAGIGVLIFVGQFHVLVDDKPRGSGIENLLSIPESIYKGVFPVDGSAHHMAAAIGMFTIVVIVAWNKFRPHVLRSIPGPLIGVVCAAVSAYLFELPIAYVSVPENITSAFTWISGDVGHLLSDVGFMGSALGLALIASAETLLCATAVDRLHDGPRTNYDKELRAQGIGNVLCGVVGALPMTGVIVRSSANVEAGGKTRLSAILHGVWILVLVVLLPQVLAMIPTASLAAVLVYTGFKLVNITAAKNLYAKGWTELAIWAATVATIIATDLLTGVMVGFALALLRLLSVFTRLEVSVKTTGERHDVYLNGAATFITIPRLAAAIESIPRDTLDVHFHLDHLAYIDHGSIELIDEWSKRHAGEVFLETDLLHERNHDRVLLVA